MSKLTTRTNPPADPSFVHQPGSSAAPFEVLLPDFVNLTLVSMQMKLPTYDQTVSPSTPGQEAADLMEADTLLPGLIIIDDETFLGVVCRDMFFSVEGK
jgi:hypothetical protein